MRAQIMTTAIVTVLAVTAIDFWSASHAAGVLTGTREKITFEGLAHARKEKIVPNGYDGLNWSEVFAVGKRTESGTGFLSVIRGKVAATLESHGQGVEGSFGAASGTFSLKSGHFAAAANAAEQTTFSAYKSGVLVGTKQVTLDPADTLVRFDDTFSGIDTVIIDGVGDGGDVAMDDLTVRF